MDLLIASNSVPVGNAGAIPAAGTPQYAGDGNIAAMTPATELPAYHYNGVMQELINVILQGGLAPNRYATNQVIQSLMTIFAMRKFWIGATAAVVVPTWSNHVLYGAWGGGGGGAAASLSFAGGGGGGGGYSENFGAVTPGETLNITIGAGGVGVGEAGSSTSVVGVTGPAGTVATGGAGGTPGGSPTGSVGIGGAGGIGTGTEIQFSGQGGQNGVGAIVTGSFYHGGMGGAAGGPGGGGMTNYPGSNVGGIAGNYPGGGGSGGNQFPLFGGNGAPGLAWMIYLP